MSFGKPCSCYFCTREIRITKAIGEVKKAILKGSRDIALRQPAGVHHG